MLWGAATAGAGRLRYQDRGADSPFRKLLSSDLTLASGGFGGRYPLLVDRLALEGLFQSTRLASTGSTDPDGPDGEYLPILPRTVRTRDADASLVWTPDLGPHVSPALRASMRWLDGDGRTGREGALGLDLATATLLDGRASLAGSVEVARGLGDLESRSTRLSLTGSLAPQRGGSGLMASYRLSAVEDGDYLPWGAKAGYGVHSALAGAVVRPYFSLAGYGHEIFPTFGVERVMARPGDSLSLSTTRTRHGAVSRAQLRVGF